MSEKRKPNGTDSHDWDLPAWVDASFDRTTPRTEEELDLLVDGTLEGIRDTAAWMNLVERVGEEEARRVLRARLIMRDENAGRQPRH